MKKLILGVCLVIAYSALAADRAPYAGQQHRSIKSLSEQEIRSLRAGEGMGFALPAELNGYPGPRHVLELAAELRLTREQLAETQALYDAMHSEAVALGEMLIGLEKDLDDDFGRGSIDAATLESALLESGVTKAKLRHVHLRTHLRQKELLSAEQVASYNRLRGYAGGAHHHDSHHSTADADKDALQALDQAYADNWKAADADGVIALFTEDATLVPHHGDPPITGRESIRNFWFDPAYPPTLIREWTRDAKEIFVSGDVGVVRGRARLVWDYEGMRTTIPESNYVLIAVRLGDDWKIRILTWNDDPREWIQATKD
ncbi:MAG: SgcJ/EcaC family oxidoreductase [Gammaproteobacteria bacterium]|nr:SgcJ/EcaC family oxidoreductase [Gammaproteobacteria bacterium]